MKLSVRKLLSNSKPSDPFQIQKRRYSAFPPSFYSTFGFGDMPTSQRHVLLPYTDLLFNGR
ncbi:unnamed protein product [Haemonchus placei]|uniref:Uncharacterized protein n=1 Tax=Haemonchus placei TaxID=6290 RepID=A0A0N4VZ03_HAEPC|nr:unnamed protein product [Haemonchus placei]